MAVTIQQIAERAGVSRGTVDRALNHRGRIRPEVAQQVLQAAQELGYVTRSQKRLAANGGYRKTIGVVTQLSGASFMIAIRRGLHEAMRQLEKQGVRVLLRESEGVDAAGQLRLIDGLTAEGIDALALMPVECDAVRARLGMLSAAGMPVITFNSDIVGAGRRCFVGLDNEKSGRVAAGLMGMMLRGQGRVLGITGSFSNSAGSRRIDGFVSGLMAEHPGIELVGVQSSLDKTAEVERCILQAMGAYPDLGGILVVSGGQAGVEQAFRQLRPAWRPFVILYDLTPKNARLLQEGAADLLIDQDGYTQGYRALSLLGEKLLWNKDPEREYMYTDIAIKTKEAL